MIVRLIRWWLKLFTPLSILTWFIGAFIATSGTMLYYARRPPGTVISIVEDASLTRSGDGKLRLVLHVDRNRYCPGDTQRWLFRKEAGAEGEPTPVYLPLGNIPSPPVGLGDTTYAIELTIPTEWDRPDVFYVSRTNFHCGPLAALFDPPPQQSKPLPINADEQ